jgi:hypothetical protein
LIDERLDEHRDGPTTMTTSIPRLLCGLAGCLLLAACAGWPPQPVKPGQTEAEVLARAGPPTGRYRLPDGGTRLEYATGPFGRTTWMVDLDGNSRVTGARQVLTDTHLMQMQVRIPGMPREDLLRELGRPGERRAGSFLQGGEVWSWRYATNDCLWFQVSIGDDGVARSGSFGTDPSCDAGGDPRR